MNEFISAYLESISNQQIDVNRKKIEAASKIPILMGWCKTWLGNLWNEVNPTDIKIECFHNTFSYTMPFEWKGIWGQIEVCIEATGKVDALMRFGEKYSLQLFIDNEPTPIKPELLGEILYNAVQDRYKKRLGRNYIGLTC